MKHNVGDRVKIKSLDWFSSNAKICRSGTLIVESKSGNLSFTEHMAKYCGKVSTIVAVHFNHYQLDIDDIYLWDDYMFEDSICNYAYRGTESEEYNKKIIEYLESLGGINSAGLKGRVINSANLYYFISYKGEIVCLHKNYLEGEYILTDKLEQTMKERVFKINLETAKKWFNEGGELKKVALQVYTENELTEFPKTWEECYTQLGKGEYIDTYSSIIRDCSLINPSKETLSMIPCGYGKPMLAFMQLLICRDTYRNGWKPNYQDSSKKYCIYSQGEGLAAGTNYDIYRVLSFQSPEIRDKFLINFRSLIEEAKELI